MLNELELHKTAMKYYGYMPIYIGALKHSHPEDKYT